MGESRLSRRAVWAALALAVVVSTGLIWHWGSGLSLIGDEWGYALRTATEPAQTYLFNPPPGKHLIAVPMLFYKAAFDTVGIDDYAPYRVVQIVLLLLCAGLFFTLARRRAGDALAVMATAILLFLGPARDVVASPLRIPLLIATAAGLAMLLALERRDLKWDVAACLLLGVSLASLGTSFPFAAAAVVLVLARPSPERWRRAWVFAIPIALYAIWWVLEFDPGPNPHPLLSTLVDLPVYLGKAIGVSVLTVTGLVGFKSSGALDFPVAVYGVIGAPLVLLLLWAIVARVRRPEPLSPFFVAMVAALLTFWVATAFAPGPYRLPYASRYLYIDAVLLLLLLCELARGFDLPRRLTRNGIIALLAVFAIAMTGNVIELHSGAKTLTEDSEYTRVGLTSLEMARGTVAPDFQLATVVADQSTDPGAFPLGLVVASGFLRILDSYGSPAYTPQQVPSLSPGLRQAADAVLVQALQVRLQPTAAAPRGTAAPPKPLVPSAASWRSTKSGCVKLPSSQGAADAAVTLPVGGATIQAGPDEPATISLGRFADGTPVSLGSVAAGKSAKIQIPLDSPQDRSTVPWRMGIANPGGVTVCGSSGPAGG